MKNSDTIQFYKHQLNVLEKNPPRYGLFHDVGTGKTITGIYLANKNCDSVLVIVPKTNKGDWNDSMAKHSQSSDWLVLTKEEFKKQARTLKKYDGVIVDEGHYFFGVTSQMSKSLMAYFKKHNIFYRWLMTATPYLSTPLNIYIAARLLGHEWNYRYFVSKFFYEIPMGGRLVKKPRTDEATTKELNLLLKTIGETVDIGDLVVVPEQKHEVVRFELVPEQTKAIGELDEAVFITRWTKKHQIENGVLMGGESGPRHIINPKADWIVKNIADKPKVAIFCRYREQITQYKALISYIYPDKEIFELHGGILNRYEVIHAAEENPNAVILIQTECSAGYELPSFDYIIFASLSFSYISYKQGQGRFLRINRLKENTFVHLVSEGVDSDIYECIMKKKDFSFDIYK